MTILTKNTDKLRKEVAAHVAADSIVQSIYWDDNRQQGCFIGCLAKGDNPVINQTVYGLPVMVQRIAESIFEGLRPDEAKEFFAAFPDAVGCDGKDLSRVSWQFLAAELQALPKQPSGIQAVIDPVIEGMNMLANGKSWPVDAADAAQAAARAATAACAADDAAAAVVAAWAADAVWAAADATVRAAWGADAAQAAAQSAAWAAANVRPAWAADDFVQAALLRQRDLLLRLISEAPIVDLTPSDLGYLINSKLFAICK